MERRNYFRGFFLLCKHTYFMVQFGYFRKANNKNFKFLSDNQAYYKWYCIRSIGNVNERMPFWQYKITTYSYMWCVTLVTARFYVFKINNRNIKRPKISNLKNAYQSNINWCCSSVVIVNFRHISHVVYLFLSTFHKKLSLMMITLTVFLACLML